MQCYKTLKPDVKKEFNNLLIIMSIILIILSLRLILLCIQNILDLKQMDVEVLIAQCSAGAVDIVILGCILLHIVYVNDSSPWNRYYFIAFLIVSEYAIGLPCVFNSTKSSIIIYHYIVIALTLTPFAYLLIKYVVILPIMHIPGYIMELRTRVNNRMHEQESGTPS